MNDAYHSHTENRTLRSANAMPAVVSAPPRRRPRLPLAGALVALLGMISGCGLSPGGDGAEYPDASSSRDVLLYLYPPSGASYPAQATDQLRVESGTVGEIPLDPGVDLSTELMIYPPSADGTPSQPQSVSGLITAVETRSQLSYSGRANADSTVDLRLPTGTYDITITWDGDGTPFPPQFMPQVDITARSANQFSVPEIDLGVEFRVRLLDSEGKPVQNASVYTLDADTGVRSSIALTIGNEAEGEYVLQALHGPQQLWVGPSAENLTIANHCLGNIAVSEQMELAQDWAVEVSASHVTGRVVDALGTPLEGVSVLLTRSSEGQEGSFSTTLTTQSDGSYAADLPTGDYDIVFRPQAVSDNTFDAPLSGARLRNVHNLAEYPLVVGDMVLVAGRTVTGTVQNDEGLAEPNAEVYFSSTDRANNGQGTVSDENGNFQVVLGVGDYSMEITPAEGGLLARKVIAVTITAETESLTAIRLDLGFASSYQFTIDGQPLAGVLVDVREVPADSTSVWLAQYRLASALTDSEGKAMLVLPFDPSQSRDQP